MQDILDSTPKDVDSVTVDPDGKWSMTVQRSPSADFGPNSDDEDIIEIQPLNQSMRVNPSSQTPSSSGMGEGTAIPRSSSKRPITQIIDLTLSDDDEPPRPAKRPTGQIPTQPLLNQTQAILNGSGGYQFKRSPLTIPGMLRTSGEPTPGSIHH